MGLRKIFSGLFYIFLSLPAVAQNAQADSLKRVLAGDKEDTFKVHNLLALSKNGLGLPPDEALKFAHNARDLSARLQFKKGKALALKNIGMIYYNQGKYLETLDYWNQSLNMFTSLGDKVGEANMLSNIGAVYSNQTEDIKALEYYFQSLRLAEQIGDKLRLATVYINIGNVYYYNPVNHNKALEYFIKSLSLSEELEDKNTIGSAAANIGEIYLDRNQFDSAPYYFNKSKTVLGNCDVYRF